MNEPTKYEDLVWLQKMGRALRDHSEHDVAASIMPLALLWMGFPNPSGACSHGSSVADPKDPAIRIMAITVTLNESLARGADIKIDVHVMKSADEESYVVWCDGDRTNEVTATRGNGDSYVALADFLFNSMKKKL